jgi:hypothetical protein
MNVLMLLEEITLDQANGILLEFEQMPKPDYQEATLRARIAAATLRKPTWSLFSMTHVNALLLGINRLKYGHPYGTMRLMTAVECYAFAAQAQNGLTYEDYNLSIGPVASILCPEMFANGQDWEIDRVVRTDYGIPYRPPSYVNHRPKKPRNEGDGVDSLAKELIKTIKGRGQKSPFTSAPPKEVDTASSVPSKEDLMEIMRKRLG